MAAALAQRRAQVAELTQQHWTLRQIAAKLGVTKRTVSRDRLAIGISHPRNRPWTAQDQSRAKQLLADGCSLADVAATLGRNPSTVHGRFKGMGWTDEQTGAYNAMRAWERRVLG